MGYHVKADKEEEEMRHRRERYNARVKADRHIIAEVEQQAREHGLSYGHYVALYGSELPKPESGGRLTGMSVDNIPDKSVKTCPVCGRVFISKGRSRRVYCSDDCYWRANRLQNQMRRRYKLC